MSATEAAAATVPDVVTGTDPSSPAFWAAAAQRRASSAVARVDDWRAATALLVRRRPPSELEELFFEALPEGCPVA